MFNVGQRGRDAEDTSEIRAGELIPLLKKVAAIIWKRQFKQKVVIA